MAFAGPSMFHQQQQELLAIAVAEQQLARPAESEESCCGAQWRKPKRVRGVVNSNHDEVLQPVHQGEHRARPLGGENSAFLPAASPRLSPLPPSLLNHTPLQHQGQALLEAALLKKSPVQSLFQSIAPGPVSHELQAQATGQVQFQHLLVQSLHPAQQSLPSPFVSASPFQVDNLAQSQHQHQHHEALLAQGHTSHAAQNFSFIERTGEVQKSAEPQIQGRQHEPQQQQFQQVFCCPKDQAQLASLLSRTQAQQQQHPLSGDGPNAPSAQLPRWGSGSPAGVQEGTGEGHGSLHLSLNLIGLAAGGNPCASSAQLAAAPDGPQQLGEAQDLELDRTLHQRLPQHLPRHEPQRSPAQTRNPGLGSSHPAASAACAPVQSSTGLAAAFPGAPLEPDFTAQAIGALLASAKSQVPRSGPGLCPGDATPLTASLHARPPPVKGTLAANSAATVPAAPRENRQLTQERPPSALAMQQEMPLQAKGQSQPFQHHPHSQQQPPPPQGPPSGRGLKRVHETAPVSLKENVLMDSGQGSGENSDLEEAGALDFSPLPPGGAMVSDSRQNPNVARTGAAQVFAWSKWAGDAAPCSPHVDGSVQGAPAGSSGIVAGVSALCTGGGGSAGPPSGVIHPPAASLPPAMAAGPSAGAASAHPSERVAHLPQQYASGNVPLGMQAHASPFCPNPLPPCSNQIGGSRTRAAADKRRRDGIRDKVEMLRLALPDSHSRMSTEAVLTAALAYIKELNAQVNALQTDKGLHYPPSLGPR